MEGERKERERDRETQRPPARIQLLMLAWEMTYGGER